MIAPVVILEGVGAHTALIAQGIEIHLAVAPVQVIIILGHKAIVEVTGRQRPLPACPTVFLVVRCLGLEPVAVVKPLEVGADLIAAVLLEIDLIAQLDIIAGAAQRRRLQVHLLPDGRNKHMGSGILQLRLGHSAQGHIEVLRRGAVPNRDLHGTAGDAHGEIQIGADAAVILAHDGGTAPGGQMHADNVVDAARTGHGDAGLAVLRAYRGLGHADHHGLRLVLILDDNGAELIGFGDLLVAVWVLEHQHKLAVAVRGFGVQRRHNQVLGLLARVEVQPEGSAGIGVLHQLNRL